MKVVGSRMENDYKEIVLLLKYTINHNESHTNELKELFLRIKSYDDSLDENFNEAVNYYDKGTAKLKEILAIFEAKKAN